MAGSWRGWSTAERHAVPVEMRFIDLFMAALGALIFMAMLLSFLLRFLPAATEHGGRDTPQPDAPGRLEIATRRLPPARVGEPYEVAFAHRGGEGAIAWRIAKGEEEVPAGMRFDPATGMLAGTPTAPATARFVLGARDAGRGSAQRPLELVVEPAARGSGRIETWVSLLLLAAVLLLWISAIGATLETKGRLAMLRTAYAEGRSAVRIRVSRTEEHEVELPAGIGDYQRRLAGMRGAARFLLLLLLVLAAWFVWRVWIA